MLASLSLASVGVRVFLSVCNYMHLNMCAFMSMGAMCTYVYLNASLHVCEGALPVCVYNICVSSHTLRIHNDIVRFALPALREVYQGNSGLSKLPFLPFLSLSLLPIYASFLPPSAPLFLVSWWGDPDVKGGTWTGKGEREREREKSTSLWWQTSLSKTFWTSL